MRSYVVYSANSLLCICDSLEQAKSACFKDFDNNRISYYTICVYNFDKMKVTKIHYSRIQFCYPTSDTRFPEFVLDYGRTNNHYYNL